MAAGLGFKDFTTGEVLTAADVDGYLMQGVWVFASAAARDAAVTSPQEGNFAYLKDTNVTTYYTGSAWANLDTTGMTNPMTTTGDIIYSSSGSTPARLGIGSTGNVLTVAGGVPSWAAPTSSSGPTFRARRTTAQSINQNTWTKMQLSTEDWDTANNFDSTTNYRFTPTTAGYYQIQAEAVGVAASASGFNASIYKNGASYLGANLTIGADGYAGITIAGQVYFNGSSDYVELFGFLTASGTRTIEGRMDGVWIRS